MKLQMDFPLIAVVAVFTELANRSSTTEARPEELIFATPVTHHHFGGMHYYSKVHRRHSWARPAVNESGELDPSRIVVAMGYADPPEDWLDLQNRMKHTFVVSEVEAADVIVGFILDGTLPAPLYDGDYPYFEPELK